MAVVLRLMRAGAKKRPFYRVVAADGRRQRDGRFLEIVGHYDPLRTPYELVIEKDQVEKWLSRGAVPSEQVSSLLRNAGMLLSRPSAPKKKPAAAAVTAAVAKPKAKTAKKRAPRKVSARKTQKKAARKSGKKPALKKAKKK